MMTSKRFNEVLKDNASQFQEYKCKTYKRFAELMVDRVLQYPERIHDWQTATQFPGQGQQMQTIHPLDWLIPMLEVIEESKRN